jgi:YD repeat-containing protein
MNHIGNRTLILLVTVFVSSCVAGSVFAQTDPVFDTKGFQPNHDYFSQLPFEHIDTLTGGLILTFTDLVLPGNAGHDLRFQRTYNSKGPSGAPWSFGLAGIPMQVIHPDGPPIPPAIGDTSTMPVLVGPDGSLHNTTFQPDGQAMTREFWKYNPATHVASLPDGTVCTYNQSGNLSEIRDPFHVSVVWISMQATGWHIQQDLGNSEIRDVYVDIGAGGITALRYGARNWTYQPDLAHLAHAIPPVGRSWDYEYDVSGNLRSVTSPLGGTVSYTYQLHEFTWQQEVDLPYTTHVYSLVVASRTVGGGATPGTWTYTYDENVPYPYSHKTTIDGPTGGPTSRRQMYFHGVISGSIGTSYPVPQHGVLRRTLEAPPGNEIEREDRSYTDLIGYDGADGEVSQQTITRAGGLYTTTYSYHTTDYTHFADYHLPYQIVESGELGRTTTRTLQHLSTPYIVGQIAAETTRVGSDTYNKSWTYETSTGFMQSQTIYGLVTTFQPDGMGNVSKVTKGNETAATMTHSFGMMKDVVTAHTTVSREINPDGTVASETRGTRQTTFRYDDLSRIIYTQPPGGTSPITTTYDGPAGAGTVLVQRGASSTLTGLDGFGRPIAMAAGAGVRTSTAYDAEGRKTYEGYPFDTTLGSANGGTDIGTVISYDGLGRVANRRNPDGTSVTFNYDQPGKVAITDENGHATVQTRRAFGNPDDTRLVAVKDAKGHEWTYTYDGLGQLRAVSAPDASNVVLRSWEYNDRQHPSLLSREKHPESGTTEFTGYDGAGNVKSKKDANGTEFVYQYDGNDRQLRKSSHTARQFLFRSRT